MTNQEYIDFLEATQKNPRNLLLHVYRNIEDFEPEQLRRILLELDLCLSHDLDLHEYKNVMHRTACMCRWAAEEN